MLASFLTTLLFALSVIFASRSVKILGGPAANFSRLCIAFALLGAWAAIFGHGGTRAAFPWFLFSGAIGFGMGDTAMFFALPRIGPRLSILLVQCLAAPIGALIDRVWLGTTLSGAQMVFGAVILAGVGIALAPLRRSERKSQVNPSGVLFGVVAALGQALGAIVTRKANAVAALENLVPDGGTAAFQRMIGGFAVTAIFYSILKITAWRDAEKISPHENLHRWRRGWLWVVLNALAGPAIGVGCYQWALASAPGGVVLAIVATTPVVTMPLAFFIDGDTPPRHGVIGGVMAVAGSIALALVSHRD